MKLPSGTTSSPSPSLSEEISIGTDLLTPTWARHFSAMALFRVFATRVYKTYAQGVHFSSPVQSSPESRVQVLHLPLNQWDLEALRDL